MPRSFVAIVVVVPVLVSACEYGKLLRLNALKQLDPDIARLVNELPEVDAQNEATVGRLFVHGGLSHAEMGSDGVMRDTIEIPPGEFIWEPAVIVMPAAGELELVIENHDSFSHHAALLPSNGDRHT